MVSSSAFRGPADPGDGVRELVARVNALEREVSALRGAGPMRAFGAEVDETGMTIGTSLAVTGDLTATGETVLNGALDVGAATTIGGDLDVSGLLRVLASAIVSGNIRSSNFVAGSSGWRLTSTGLEVNDITLRGGIIGNDALTDPVRATAGSANTGTAVSIGTSAGSYATVTISVPTGYSRAFVQGSSSIASANAVAAYIATRIDGTDGLVMPLVSAPNGALSGAVTFAREVTGLSGGSLTVTTRAFGSSAFTGYVVTSCNVIFLR